MFMGILRIGEPLSRRVTNDSQPSVMACLTQGPKRLPFGGFGMGKENGELATSLLNKESCPSDLFGTIPCLCNESRRDGALRRIASELTITVNGRNHGYLSGPLQQAIQNGLINLLPIP
jgi:hypothetical protein